MYLWHLINNIAFLNCKKKQTLFLKYLFYNLNKKMGLVFLGLFTWNHPYVTFHLSLTTTATDLPLLTPPLSTVKKKKKWTENVIKFVVTFELIIHKYQGVWPTEEDLPKKKHEMIRRCPPIMDIATFRPNGHRGRFSEKCWK